MFSVVIPLYNKEASIKKTLSTVLNQSFSEFEVIIVNDGSTDDSVKVVSLINDERIRVINKVNGGVSSARNLGIKSARYNFIAFIDGDDLWHVDFLATINGLISRFPTADGYATGYALQNRAGHIISERKAQKEGLVDNYFRVLNESYYSLVHSSAVCVKKSAFSDAMLFNENIAHGEDLDMWCRLFKNKPIALTVAVRSYYIQDSENRAMDRLSTASVKKNRIYHLKLNGLNDIHETKYYKNLIIRWVLKNFRKGNIKHALMIFLKYILFAHPVDYFKYMAKR